MTANPARLDAERRGRGAEAKCIWWLCFKGYALLARRYRSNLGEIDIIARRGGLLVFVEVKSRPTAGQALHAITGRQRARVSRAASLFVAAHPALAGLTMRYDLMIVLPWQLPRHVQGAWID